jgi:hypothetical protein
LTVTGALKVSVRATSAAAPRTASEGAAVTVGTGTGVRPSVTASAAEAAESYRELVREKRARSLAK